MQLALFDNSDRPAPPSYTPPGYCYIAHFFQRSGPALWKLGYTEASPLVRARQIRCVPVAWWPGSMLDERRMHRQWKTIRFSPAAEFFEHGHSIDRWVLLKVTEMPPMLRDRQLETFAQVMLRLSARRGYGEAA